MSHEYDSSPSTSRHLPVTERRRAEVYCKIDGKRIFKVTEFETTLRYATNKSWTRDVGDASSEDLGLEIEPSDLEKIGLQADSLGKINLIMEDNRLVKVLKTATKYVLGIGVPLAAAYFVADHLFDLKIQDYIARNLPRMIEEYPVRMREFAERYIRTHPRESVSRYVSTPFIPFGVIFVIGGLTSLVSGVLIRENTRARVPEFKRVKRILKKHAKKVS